MVPVNGTLRLSSFCLASLVCGALSLAVKVGLLPVVSGSESACMLATSLLLAAVCAVLCLRSYAYGCGPPRLSLIWSILRRRSVSVCLSTQMALSLVIGVEVLILVWNLGIIWANVGRLVAGRIGGHALVNMGDSIYSISGGIVDTLIFGNVAGWLSLVLVLTAFAAMLQRVRLTARRLENTNLRLVESSQNAAVRFQALDELISLALYREDIRRAEEYSRHLLALAERL